MPTHSEIFLLAGMGLVLLAFTGLVRAGSRVLGPEARRQEPDPPQRWPSLALIVPVAGAPPGLAARLEALLCQDYPDYQVIFATRDQADPATRLISSLIWGRSRARLVVAGPARNCGQKNQNLLAGVKLAGEVPEILAFCDSNQEAPPDFLQKLVAPVARGEGVVTSGYHHVIPGDNRLATWGRAISVLTLYLTKAIPWLNQPWGGATAIRRDAFESLHVAHLWSETVVDDVSLAALLVHNRIPVCLSQGADLATKVSGETMASWQSWLFRQWIYLKYYLPGSWMAAGVLLHLLTGFTIMSLAQLPLAFLGWGTRLTIILSAAFLIGLASLALALRRLHPIPRPPRPFWLAASLASLGLASWVHLKTSLTQKISWRGKVYQVDWRGRVSTIWE
jgi:ceramide glucosyltransferase|uniref:Glycosyltransferase n=1 Tax=Desulfobacca acetoxidans TaxID=60893 RepID=A0A7V6A1Z7_9BACT